MIQIFVKSEKGEINVIEIERFRTVLDLKLMIEEKEGVPHDQQIIEFEYTGKELRNEFSLVDYNVQNMNSFKMRLNLRSRIICEDEDSTLNIMVMEGSIRTTTCQVTVRGSNTVIELSRKIKEKTNIGILSQLLFFDGIQFGIPLKSTLTQIGIEKSGTIQVKRKTVGESNFGNPLSPNQEGKIIIEQPAQNDKKNDFFVTSKCTIGELKKMINIEEEGISEEKFKFIYKSNYLIGGDEKSLSDFKINDGDTIHLIIRP